MHGLALCSIKGSTRQRLFLLPQSFESSANHFLDRAEVPDSNSSFTICSCSGVKSILTI
jgi:hypothetical protein